MVLNVLIHTPWGTTNHSATWFVQFKLAYVVL